MSWAEELYNVYETQCNDSKMLKVAHSTANSQIEITITEEGDFATARALSKEEGKNTVIPVTESSGGRTSGIAPMPFADKLKYIAGDYQQYTSEDNSEHYSLYIEQLESWKDSEYSHPAVVALYNYLSKGTVISDLLKIPGVLELNESGLLSDDYKIGGVSEKDAFVRFVVLYSNITGMSKTWADDTLSECFIQFNKGLFKTLGLCYATGKESALTENHPSKIRNTGDSAKLFSANDESGFTYRGRFLNKSETVLIGYEFSQKMHNALKWLVERQGKKYGEMMTVVWSSAMQPMPDLSSTPIDDLFGDEEEPSETPPDTMPAYRELLGSIIFGYKKDIPIHSKVMILGLDAATKGRMSVAMYSELQSSDFFQNFMKWHSDTVVLRYNGKLKSNCYNSFSVYEIVNCAFGTETSKGYLECKPEVLSDTILRIMPCIVEGKPFPQDIMWALYHNASNPQAYDIRYHNHQKVLQTACGMIYKFYTDHPNYRKGEISMAYNPNEDNRSYLYGCLLAVADVAERETYDNDKDKAERVTNARRYWNAFSKRPYVTWQRIEEQLIPYLNKLGGKRVRYEKMLQEIKGKFTPESFADNKALEPLYLLGFHHYTTEIFTSKKKEEN
ncbi:MAG: type I-C CRISPR-associated protein Cas8c/Csd1 [Oscillospiraceae bacterium]